MGRALAVGIAICLMAGLSHAQSGESGPGSRTVLGGGNALLAAGANAILFGKYDEGIRLTRLGLRKAGTPPLERAAALSNLCAALAAKRQPDQAIQYCDKALILDSHNWRAYSNRSYAYWLKGMYSRAVFDVDAAAALAPNAAPVRKIREMINESRLKPHVVVEEHP